MLIGMKIRQSLESRKQLGTLCRENLKLVLRLLWKTVWQWLKMTELPREPAVVLLESIPPGEMRARPHTKLYTPVLGSSVPSSQKAESAQVFVSRVAEKHLHTHP